MNLVRKKCRDRKFIFFVNQTISLSLFELQNCKLNFFRYLWVHRTALCKFLDAKINVSASFFEFKTPASRHFYLMALKSKLDNLFSESCHFSWVGKNLCMCAVNKEWKVRLISGETERVNKVLWSAKHANIDLTDVSLNIYSVNRDWECQFLC